MDEVRIILPEKKTGRLHILAAVSGGADSVALLALLREAALTQPFDLTAAHFEHGIRAEDSLADAAFVRILCAEWGIRLIEGHGNVPAEAKRRSIGLEEAARDARYEFLNRARLQIGADYIALAHHRDDQAETVLMHLFRGAGLNGMKGMRPVDGVLYRPLLDVPKETLVGYLIGQGIPWREDATNTVPDNPRNALRLHVLPEVERIYPGAKRAVSRFSQIAAEEDAYMERQSMLFEREHAVEFPGMKLLELRSEGEAWRAERALLMRTVRRLTGLPFEAAVRIMDLWENQGGPCAVDAGGGWRGERGSLGLYLIFKGSKKAGMQPMRLKSELRLPDGLGRLKVSRGSGVPVTDQPFCQELDASRVEGAVIRTRRNGDVIHPLGAPGRQKLSDYFINRKIDRPLRDVIPLLAKGNEILWVMGQGISEKAKLKEDTQAVRLEWTDSPLQKFGGKSNA